MRNHVISRLNYTRYLCLGVVYLSILLTTSPIHAQNQWFNDMKANEFALDNATDVNSFVFNATRYYRGVLFQGITQDPLPDPTLEWILTGSLVRGATEWYHHETIDGASQWVPFGNKAYRFFNFDISGGTSTLVADVFDATIDWHAGAGIAFSASPAIDAVTITNASPGGDAYKYIEAYDDNGVYIGQVVADIIEDSLKLTEGRGVEFKVQDTVAGATDNITINSGMHKYVFGMYNSPNLDSADYIFPATTTDVGGVISSIVRASTTSMHYYFLDGIYPVTDTIECNPSTFLGAQHDGHIYEGAGKGTVFRRDASGFDLFNAGDGGGGARTTQFRDFKIDGQGNQFTSTANRGEIRFGGNLINNTLRHNLVSNVWIENSHCVAIQAEVGGDDLDGLLIDHVLIDGCYHGISMSGDEGYRGMTVSNSSIRNATDIGILTDQYTTVVNTQISGCVVAVDTANYFQGDLLRIADNTTGMQFQTSKGIVTNSWIEDSEVSGITSAVAPGSGPIYLGNVIFERNGRGVNSAGNLIMDGCSVLDSDGYGLQMVFAWAAEFAKITDTVFQGNNGDYNILVGSAASEYFEISNCVIKDGSGGINLTSSATSAPNSTMISNNLFQNNSGGTASPTYDINISGDANSGMISNNTFVGDATDHVFIKLNTGGLGTANPDNFTIENNRISGIFQQVIDTGDLYTEGRPLHILNQEIDYSASGSLIRYSTYIADGTRDLFEHYGDHDYRSGVDMINLTVQNATIENLAIDVTSVATDCHFSYQVLTGAGTSDILETTSYIPFGYERVFVDGLRIKRASDYYLDHDGSGYKGLVPTDPGVFPSGSVVVVQQADGGCEAKPFNILTGLGTSAPIDIGINVVTGSVNVWRDGMQLYSPDFTYNASQVIPAAPTIFPLSSVIIVEYIQDDFNLEGDGTGNDVFLGAPINANRTVVTVDGFFMIPSVNYHLVEGATQAGYDTLRPNGSSIFPASSEIRIRKS